MTPRLQRTGEGLWHHVDPNGAPAYPQRYRAASGYSEGLAVVHTRCGRVGLIDVKGRELDLGGEAFDWVLPMVESRAQARRTDGTHGWLDAAGAFHTERQDPEWLGRLELVRLARLIYERGYNTSIDGNLSLRLNEDELMMTPSGKHSGFLRPEDLVVVDPVGRLLRGSGAPTSEYRLHTALYRRRPDIGSVVHVHSPFAVAASLAGLDLAQTYITVAPVPTTAYAQISSGQSPAAVQPFAQDYNWAILPRHGTVASAGSAWEAFLRIEGLEHYAKIVVSARACGPIEPLPSDRRLELLTFWGLEHLEAPA